MTCHFSCTFISHWVVKHKKSLRTLQVNFPLSRPMVSLTKRILKYSPGLPSICRVSWVIRSGLKGKKFAASFQHQMSSAFSTCKNCIESSCLLQSHEGHKMEKHISCDLFPLWLINYDDEVSECKQVQQEKTEGSPMSVNVFSGLQNFNIDNTVLHNGPD